MSSSTARQGSIRSATRGRLARALAWAVVPGLAGALVATGPAAAAGAGSAGRPTAYDLPEAGVYLEGIGIDQRAGTLYVSATNRDGTIYRGTLGSPGLTVWVGPRAGDNGRGIAVDGLGRVYVAGGPTGEVRVFDRAGTLLGEPGSGEAGSFLNDVWIGPDGAAYVTDSSLPVIRRVTLRHGTWQLERWLDVSASVPYTASLTDFDLGGIVSTPDRRYLLLAQGTTGALWRVDLRTRQVRQVAVAGAPLVNADGLALRGHSLVVVQNFTRQLTVLRLDEDWTRARPTAVVPTPADRTLTTADLARGRLLVVDAQFGFAAPPAEDRVITFDLP